MSAPRIVKPADHYTLEVPGRLTLHGTRADRQFAEAQGELMRLTEKPNGSRGPAARPSETPRGSRAPRR